MSLIANVLARRETQVIVARVPQADKILLQLFIFLITCIALALVDYICSVITVLAAIEDVDQTAYICLDDEGPKDPETGDSLNKRPITSGLGSAIKYLYARGGIRSCFRGFRMCMAVLAAETVLAAIAGFVSPLNRESLLSLFLVQFIATMPFAAWRMACVHRMIADKSPKTKHRRITGFRYWPRIAPAAALYNFVNCMTIALLFSVAESAGWITKNVVNESGYKVLASLLLGIMLPTIAGITLSLPARVIFIRVAASMLPTEDVPIVPFDPQFGGKVDPNVADRSSLRIVDAWNTLSWLTLFRISKLLFLTLCIENALGAVGAFVGVILL
ncbi:hypothetical protein MYU51_004623 [Penicillium brevicompactum]